MEVYVSVGGDSVFVRFKNLFFCLPQLVRELIMRFLRHRIGYTGGELAYFFLLSVFPFLIFTNSVIKALDIPRDAAITFLRPFFPEEIVSLIANYIGYINTRKSVGLLSFGIILSVFSASKSVRSLSAAFNLAYGTADNRRFFLRVLSSMLFILLFAAAFVVCVVFVALGSRFVTQFLADESLPTAFFALFSTWRWMTVSILLFFALLFVYKFLPQKRIRVKDSLPGTFFSLFSLLALAASFSLYTKLFVSPASIYGSFSAITLILLWFYFAGIILVLGAELNAVMLN